MALKTDFHFTFTKLEEQYRKAIDLGYEVIRCQDYMSDIHRNKKKIIVNRIDVDISLKKAKDLLDIYNKLNIKGSFFIRLHAPEYNPFSFESYRIIKRMIHEGHEVGYHSEVIDQAAIWNENPTDCLRRDLEVMKLMFGINIIGVASHGGMTGLNNLDFWKEHSPSEFGLKYEAYDENRGLDLFNKAFYISDSEWVRWKSYDKGERNEGDHRSFAEHLENGHKLIYLLIHSDTYFNEHFYE